MFMVIMYLLAVLAILDGGGLHALGAMDAAEVEIFVVGSCTIAWAFFRSSGHRAVKALLQPETKPTSDARRQTTPHRRVVMSPCVYDANETTDWHP